VLSVSTPALALGALATAAASRPIGVATRHSRVTATVRAFPQMPLRLLTHGGDGLLATALLVS